MLVHFSAFDDLVPVRRALAAGELETASALAGAISENDIVDIFAPGAELIICGARGGREATPENWPDVEPTVENFAAIRGERDFRPSTWGKFVEVFAVTPAHRDFFADYAAELDAIDWPKLFERALNERIWGMGELWAHRTRVYLQERGRELLEAVPVATYATVRVLPRSIVQLVNDTFGAAGTEWFAGATVRYLVTPKTPKVRRAYAAELLKEIAKLYPRLVIDVNVELEP